MYRAHTSFTKECAFRFLNTDELKRFVATVEVRFNAQASGYALKSVRPEKFESGSHAFALSKIFDAIERYADHIRYYEICFSSAGKAEKPLADAPYLTIRVICRSKFGDNDGVERRIVLRGSDCTDRDFAYFVKAADDVLSLSTYYPPGVDAYDVTMSSFLESTFLMPEAKAFVSGAISTKHYDLAVKSLAGLIESDLREKIISQGMPSAETAAGVDLAQMAYNKQSGVLRPPWDVANESQEGIHLMVRGFFLWIRNGFHHHARILEQDKDGALELIQLCNAILKVIEKSTPRE